LGIFSNHFTTLFWTKQILASTGTQSRKRNIIKFNPSLKHFIKQLLCSIHIPTLSKHLQSGEEREQICGEQICVWGLQIRGEQICAAEEMALLHLIPSSSSSAPFKPKPYIDLLETQFFAKKTQLPTSVLGLVVL
jgi:hypothetical protein